MKGQLMMTYYIEEGTMLTGDDCPIPTTVFAGWIDCPHCNNSRASVLRDAHDKSEGFKTDCGECDHNFPVTVVELNKYAYAYLKEIEFCDPEANLEWGSRDSFTAERTEKDRQTLLEIVRDEMFDTGKTSFDLEHLFPDEDFGFVPVEMNIVRDAMSVVSGNVPKSYFLHSDNPKRDIAKWLSENGEWSEVDYDNIIIDSFDYDRDAVDGVDVKGDY